MSTFRAMLPLLMIFSAPLFAADWPQYRGPGRNGLSAETGWSSQWPKEGPRPLWKVNVGTGSSPISVCDGKVFTQGHADGQDSIVCLDAATGKPIWKYSYASERFDQMHEGGPASAPSIDNGYVYAMGRAGDVSCLNVASGKLLWSLNVIKEFGGPLPFFAYTISPLILGDRVILTVGAKGASTVALDKTSGKVLWKSGDDPAAYASPVPFGSGKETHVAVLNGVALIIVNSQSGAELARFPWDTPSPANSRVNAASPVVSGARAFIASSYGMGGAMIEFDLAAGKAKAAWKNEALTTQYNSALIYQNHLYGFHSYGQNDGGGELRCLDAASGEVKWSCKNPGLGSLVVAGGRMVILTRGGELIVAEANPKEYKELARMQVSGTICRNEPTLCDGRIFVRNAKGDVHCFDVSKQ